jgi:hypothetical protein
VAYPGGRHNAPHSTDDALEPSKEHRPSEMDGVIRMYVVALRGLAGTEECEERTGRVMFHKLCHCKAAIKQVEAAHKRVECFLSAMAGEVEDGGFREKGEGF